MSDSKTYVFGNEGAGTLASVIPALTQRGIDPAYLMGMMGNGNGFGGNGWSDLIALIVVAGLFNNGNGGVFGGGNNSGKDAILAVLERNGVDIAQLATSFNCSKDQIMNGINAVGSQICNLAAQQGVNAERIINSIQAGDASLASQLAACCCDIKQVMSQGFSSLGYATRDQTCTLEKAIENSTSRILEGQRAAEMREMQQKIDTLQDERQTYKLGTMMAQNNAPLANAIAALQSDVDKIKCKLPNTVTLPYQEAQAVPNCFAWNLGFGFPFGGNGSLWG